MLGRRNMVWYKQTGYLGLIFDLDFTPAYQKL